VLSRRHNGEKVTIEGLLIAFDLFGKGHVANHKRTPKEPPKRHLPYFVACELRLTKRTGENCQHELTTRQGEVRGSENEQPVRGRYKNYFLCHPARRGALVGPGCPAFLPVTSFAATAHQGISIYIYICNI